MFLGVDYDKSIFQVQYYLPKYLSQYSKVIMVDHPQFMNLWKIIFKKTKLIEYKSQNLILYRSFGIFPFSRSIIIFNFVNYIINYIILVLLFKKNINNSQTITFTPEIVFLFPFINIKKKNIYYYVIDNYISLPWWSNKFQQIQFRILEKIFLRKVKNIITTSELLKEKYIKVHPKVTFFRIPSELNNYNLINKDSLLSSNPNPLSNIPKPIIGYIGTINDWKINIQLIEFLVKKNKELSFVFIGKYSKNSNKINSIIKYYSNCYHIDMQSKANLPYYVNNFDICIIPYKTNSYGKYSYPVKIMDYLILGKPVVTTALPSIRYLSEKGLIYWSRNEEEFIKNIRRTLNKKRSFDITKRRISEANKNRWETRIIQFIQIINN